MRDKNGRQEPGGEGTTPVTTACPEEVHVCEKKKTCIEVRLEKTTSPIIEAQVASCKGR